MRTARTKFADENALKTGWLESIDAATGEPLARFESTDPAAMPAILNRARAVQSAWAASSVCDRCAALRRLRDTIFDSRDEIANLISRETGKPRVEAVFAEIILALDTADFLARRAPEWLRPEPVPHHNLAVKAKSAWLEYEPLGVVAIISPWNYPFAIPIAQVIPALATGNAIVLKPSELTSATGALIAQLAGRAKLPQDIVQVVYGGGDAGSALIDAAPDKIFFTGSVETGRKVAEACARKLIPSVLELGGNDPMIVLAGADLEMASSAAVWGSFTNCGQACLSVERVYVEQSIAEKFTRLCVEKTKKLRLGPPSDPDAEIGPMIRLRQLERVERQLQAAVARGAKILTGGERRPELGANFLAPAVVTNVDPSMELMREETFGPVLAIRAVMSASEAVAMANDSAFSLSASVWTRDMQAARAVASQLRAGSVMINDVASYYGIAEAPHGGSGASGWGRAHSRFGFLEMIHVKYIDIDRLPRVAKSWWYGYSAELGAAADRFVEALFSPSWARRMAGLRRSGALVFRRDKV